MAALSPTPGTPVAFHQSLSGGLHCADLILVLDELLRVLDCVLDPALISDLFEERILARLRAHELVLTQSDGSSNLQARVQVEILKVWAEIFKVW